MKVHIRGSLIFFSKVAIEEKYFERPETVALEKLKDNI